MIRALAAAAAILPLALAAPAAPAKKGTQLECVLFQYAYQPFTYGLGWANLYANVTQWHPKTQTLTYNQTRVALGSDGKIEPCGTCQNDQSFGFEVCQTAGLEGFDGLRNDFQFFYGHLLYSTDQTTYQCLTATGTPLNGSTLSVEDCKYDYDTAGASNQYWKVDTTTGTYAAQLVSADSTAYGINPNFKQGEPLTLITGTPASGPYTFLGWSSY